MSAQADVWTEQERPRLQVHEVLSRSAADLPGHDAVVAGTERISFAGLQERVEALCAEFESGGVEAGSRVAISTTGDVTGVAVLYAVSAVGAVALPLNPYWAEPEIVDALQRGGASHLLVATERNAARESVLAAAAACAPERRPRIGMIGTASGSVTPVEWDAHEPPPCKPLDPAVAMIMFTSGSTGRPKAALQPHHALVGTAHYYRRGLRLGSDDRYLLLLPIHHTGGIVDGLLAAHLAGAAVVVLPDFDAAEVLAVYEREQITVTTAFESLLHKVESADGYAPERHRWLEKAGLAGDSRTYDRLLASGVELVIPSYALTEACSGVSIARPDRSDEERRGTVGEPLPGLEVRIVDPEIGEVLPADRQGEIQVRGWTLFCGYLEDPGVDEEGWLHTGDIGRLRVNGTLTYEGRIKNMIKSGGENVSEFEVETYLSENVPGIRQACVVGVPDEEWTEMVVAYVEMLPQAEFDAEAIRAICKRGLAGYKIPKRYWPISPGAWPLLASGKIDKVAMRGRAAERKIAEEVTA